jgi:hypothetical protein
MGIFPKHFGPESSPSQWTFLIGSQSDEELSPLLKSESCKSSSSSGSSSNDSSPSIPLSPPQIKDRLRSSLEEVDFFQSPPLSPVCSSSKSSLTLTPERVTQARELFNVLSLDCEPMPKERTVILEGMEALRLQSPDTALEKTRSKNTRELFSRLFKRGSSKVGPEAPLDLASAHDRIVQMMERVSLYGKVLTGLRAVDAKCEHQATDLSPPFEPVNYQHILTPVVSDTEKKALGFHFCPPDHPLFPTLTNIVHSSSGIYSACFKTHPSQPGKCSTFFPASIKTIEELNQVIQKSLTICRKANRSLRRHPSGMWIETLHKNGYINSAYPFFFVDDFRPGSKYQIEKDEEPLPHEIFHLIARDLLQQYVPGSQAMQNPIRYVRESKSENQTKLFIDVAPLLPYGVSQGIIFRFDKNLFNDVAHLDDIIDES